MSHPAMNRFQQFFLVCGNIKTWHWMTCAADRLLRAAIWRMSLSSWLHFSERLKSIHFRFLKESFSWCSLRSCLRRASSTSLSDLTTWKRSMTIWQFGKFSLDTLILPSRYHRKPPQSDCRIPLQVTENEPSKFPFYDLEVCPDIYHALNQSARRHSLFCPFGALSHLCLFYGLLHNAQVNWCFYGHGSRKVFRPSYGTCRPIVPPAWSFFSHTFQKSTSPDAPYKIFLKQPSPDYQRSTDCRWRNETVALLFIEVIFKSGRFSKPS